MTDEIVPRPKVSGKCRVCRVRDDDVKRGYVLVSPQGMAHFGELSYGETICGKDATGKGWWWPL